MMAARMDSVKVPLNDVKLSREPPTTYYCIDTRKYACLFLSMNLFPFTDYAAEI
jgi:hypothetical protein